MRSRPNGYALYTHKSSCMPLLITYPADHAANFTHLMIIAYQRGRGVLPPPF